MSDPVKYVTIPKQTVVRIAIACMAVGFALGLLLAFLMLVDGPC